MIDEIKISGPIVWRSDDTVDGQYLLVNKIGQGWGIRTKDLNPTDLRKMADHLEQRRNWIKYYEVKQLEINER